MIRDVNPLAAYLADLTGHDLLTADGEQALARDIEAAEIDTWACVLGSTSAREEVVREIEARFEERPRELSSLKRAATIARRRPSKRSRAALDRAIRKLSAALRERDRDRELLDAVVSRLRETPAMRGWARHMSRIDEAAARAARARNRFVHANLRLVVSIARRFSSFAMPIDDLIQEGNIGLLKAVDRFDYRRGFRFSTYASWWIRHMIGRALANGSRTVRLPVHVIDACQRIGRTERALASRLGRTPSNEEIATALHVSTKIVERARVQAKSYTLSLDEPVREGGPTRLELVRDPANHDQTMVDGLIADQRAESLATYIAGLGPREADIIRKRFGLAGENAKTLQEIADLYGLSRERIRQIEVKALDALRRRMHEVA